MRPRTPNFIWLPFVFSVGGLSWILLIAALGIMGAVIVTPVLQDVRQAEIERNDVQATVDLLDKKLALQKEFIDGAMKDPLVLERLAMRQFKLARADQEMLPIDPANIQKDQSVTSLLAESITPVKPKPVAPLPWFLEPVQNSSFRRLLVLLACVGMVLGFMLGVKFERPAVVA